MGPKKMCNKNKDDLTVDYRYVRRSKTISSNFTFYGHFHIAFCRARDNFKKSFSEFSQFF